MRYPSSDARPDDARGLAADLDDDGVLTLTLAAVAVPALSSMLRAAAADEAVRVIVIRGAGDFGAAVAPTAGAAAARDLDALGRALKAAPQPTLAMVAGRCDGVAIGLVERCDVALAAHDAVFALGAADGSWPSAPSVSRVMAPRAAAYHALVGDAFDGNEAERSGLVTRSVSGAALAGETAALARELAAKDPLALRFTKQTLEHVGSMSWDAAVDFTAAKFAELKALQAGRPSARATAVESFLSGKSKPGLG